MKSEVANHPNIKDGSADLIAYMVADPDKLSGPIGIAWVGVVCVKVPKVQPAKSSINEFYNTDAETALVSPRPSFVHSNPH